MKVTKITKKVVKKVTTKKICTGEVQDFWILFGNCKSQLGRFFVKPGFGHISVFTRAGDGFIHFDPTMFQLKMKIISSEDVAAANILKYVKKKGRRCIYIRKLATTSRTDSNWEFVTKIFPHFVTCSKLSSYVCGIRKLKFSPYGLYSYLKKVERELEKDPTKIIENFIEVREL